jgi:hypothetical protein
MKSLLICPADRPAVSQLSEDGPLAVAPVLGRCLIEYWIEALAARGATHVIVLASDRPGHIRSVVGDGSQWGVRIDLQPQSRELSVVEARARFPASDSVETADGGTTVATAEVVLMDHLPGLPEHPLFDSYASWYEALSAWIPQARTPTRIGTYEVSPGVWVGLHTHVAADARLIAPCWIGENVVVGPGAVIGPGAVLENCTVVERGARIGRSIVAPDTFVGRFISVQDSLANGGTVISWQSGSCLQVPDRFLLCSLAARQFETPGSSFSARALAFVSMILSSPAALAVMLLSLMRGDLPLQIRLGVRPQRSTRYSPTETFAYYELTGARNWLRRWPQFWSVVRGDLTWFGNRPLRPAQALTLANDFERLWLAAPVGLISLADAHDCPDGMSDEACAHASYYAVNASRRLDGYILVRCLLRALRVWPIPWPRRKTSTVALATLVPRQEG